MAACADCKDKNSRLEDKLFRLQNDLREKDKLLEGFISIASAQAKHISLMQASRISGLSPSALAPQLVSASAATLPWLGSLHSSTEPAEGRAAGQSVRSPTPRHSAGSAGCHSTSPTADRVKAGPPEDPDAGMEVGLPAHPTHCSTPKPQGQPAWSEVVQRGRRNIAGRAPSPPQLSLSLSNRFSVLNDGRDGAQGRPADPASAPAPPPSEPAPLETTPSSAASAPASAPRTSGQGPPRSAIGMQRRRLLKDAVYRRSGVFPRPSNILTPPGTSALSSSQVKPTSSRLQRSPSPSLLVIGTSLVRHVAVRGGRTFCHPGASVNDIKSAALRLSDQCSSVSTLVIEAGVNDIKKQRSEELKVDFARLVDSLLDTGKQVIVSGPLPSPCFGDIKFSRLRQLHIWQKSYCMRKSIPFVDNFAAFLNRPSLFKRDGLHPNLDGSRLLASNIRLTLHSCST